MAAGNISSILARHSAAFRNARNTATLDEQNIKRQIDASGATTSDRASKNKDNVTQTHQSNKDQEFGNPRFPGYENNHDVEQQKINEVSLEEEDVKREDRENLIEFNPGALELARQRFEDVVKTYAYIERKHRSAFQSINKYFNSTNIGSKLVSTKIGSALKYQDTADVKGEKKRFEDALEVYRNAWMRDIEARMKADENKLEGEALTMEIDDMLRTFNCEVVFELAEQRNFAQAEMLFGPRPKNVKSVQKGKLEEEEFQSVTGGETHITPGSPVIDDEGRQIVGKRKSGLVYGDGKESIYRDVYSTPLYDIHGNREEIDSTVEKKTVKEKINEKIENVKEKLTDLETYKQVMFGAGKAGWAGLEMIHGGYKKLPASVKIGLGVTAMATGIGALVVGRRVVSGISAGVGTAAWLDGKQQKSLKNRTEKGNEVNIEEIINAEGAVDFERLKSITDFHIKNVDEKMNELKVGHWFNIAAGVTLGIAIGGGWAQDYVKSGFGKFHHFAEMVSAKVGFDLPQAETGVKEWFGRMAAKVGSAFSSTAHAMEIPSDHGHLSPEELRGKLSSEMTRPENLVDQKYSSMLYGANMAPMENLHESLTTEQALHAHASEITSTEQALHTHTPETVTAEHAPNTEHALKTAESLEHPTSMKVEGKIVHGHFKSDSVWKESKALIKQLHPGATPAEINHYTSLVFNDGIKQYAIDHHISPEEAMKQLSRIHGATLDISYEANGTPHIHIKDVKFMDTPHHGGIHSAKIDLNHVAPTENPTEGWGPNYQEMNQHAIDADRAKLAFVNDRYDIAAAVQRGEVPSLDPNSPNYSSNVEYYNMLQKASAGDFKWAPSYELGRIGNVIKETEDHMNALLHMNDIDTARNLRQTFFDSNANLYHQYENVRVYDALNRPGKIKGISDKAFEKIVGYANCEATKPKFGETFKDWTKRIMEISRKESFDYKLAA